MSNLWCDIPGTLLIFKGQAIERDAMSFGVQFPTFRRNIASSSSGLNYPPKESVTFQDS